MRQRTPVVGPLVVVLLALAAPAWATPITVRPGDVVTVTFGTVPGNWDPADPPDYLQFTIGNMEWLGADQTATFALYDGDRLLGSRTGVGIGTSFIGAGMELPRGWTSLWEWPQIDSTSLLDGTIAGRLEVTPTAGSFVFDPATLATCNYCPIYTGPHPVMLFDVTPLGGFWAAQGDFDWVRDVKIGVREADVLTPVPEPATLWLVMTGAAGLWWRRRT
jgi:PEP-CTERM motif